MARIIASRHADFSELEDVQVYGLDTETYPDHTPFAVILATQANSYYFNLMDEPQVPPLYREFIQKANDVLASIFAKKENIYYAHNAMFDVAGLLKLGFNIDGRVYCTRVMHRLFDNDLLKYDLATSAKTITGGKKSTEVEEYIATNKLMTVTPVIGRKRNFVVKHFEKVPFDIITPYAFQDAELHLNLGLRLSSLLAKDKVLVRTKEIERRVTMLTARMKLRGVTIDRAYTIQARDKVILAMIEKRKALEEFVGEPYAPSPAFFTKAFKKAGAELVFTAKGNPSFTDDVLLGCKGEFGKLISELRSKEKMLATYFGPYLQFAKKDEDGRYRIYSSLDQAGTCTGRFSSRDPNLQNIPKKSEPSIRRCLVPRNEDYYLCEIDYSQQEYRLMLYYGREKLLIEQVNAGKDVHQAIADKLGISRDTAKTVSFAILYGAGPKLLQDLLELSQPEAKGLIREYYSKMPGVAKWIRYISDTARKTGLFYNWVGRRYHLKNPSLSYVAPNWVIQGGCADMMKQALCGVQGILEKSRSRIVANIHDSVLVDLHKSETDLIPLIQKEMASYRPEDCLIAFDTKASISETSLADMHEIGK